MADAWDEIQAERRDWKFLWGEFSAVITGSSANTTYTYSLAAQAPFSTFSTGALYTFGAESFWVEDAANPGAPTRRPCPVFEASYFKNLFDGRVAAAPGFPSVFTVLPDNTIRFNCPPDRNLNFGGEYMRPNQRLSGNTDLPLLPTNYHLAIVYRALRKYAGYEGAGDIMGYAVDEDEKWTRILCSEQLPRMAIGASPIGPSFGFSMFMWPA